jgi:L-arabinose isomerase
MVNGYGVGDLADLVASVPESDVDARVDQYHERYQWPDAPDDFFQRQVHGQARIECALRSFLIPGGYRAFTTTFEDLHGIDQLPGLAAQNLMADGYGFGAEGDWKTAALVRVVKVMADFQPTSFMEDYTYHLEPGHEMILGAHMLEVCPSIAADAPTVEVHPLSIGGKSDPARLVFNGRAGSAVVASLVDLGHRFRLVVNQVTAVAPPHPMPALPVGRVLWKPAPSLETSAEAWILAGGAHHTVLSYGVTTEQLADWADMAGIECVVIDGSTDIRRFAQELGWNEAVWGRRS